MNIDGKIILEIEMWCSLIFCFVFVLTFNTEFHLWHLNTHSTTKGKTEQNDTTNG